MNKQDLKQLQAELKAYKNKESKRLIEEINCYTFLSPETKTQLSKAMLHNDALSKKLNGLLEEIAKDMNSCATSLKKERESVVRKLKLDLYATKKQMKEDKQEYAARLEQAEKTLKFVKDNFNVRL